MTDRIRAALAELVRLKDMKARIAVLGAEKRIEAGMFAEFMRLNHEYNECRPKAWAEARAALAPEPHDLGVWGKLGQAVQADQCPHAAVPSSCPEVQCFMTKTCRMRSKLV